MHAANFQGIKEIKVYTIYMQRCYRNVLFFFPFSRCAFLQQLWSLRFVSTGCFPLESCRPVRAYRVFDRFLLRVQLTSTYPGTILFNLKSIVLKDVLVRFVSTMIARNLRKGRHGISWKTWAESLRCVLCDSLAPEVATTRRCALTLSCILPS